MLGRRIICKQSASGAVAISGHEISDFAVGSATAGLTLTSTGLVPGLRNFTWNTLETWLFSGAAADYEVRVTDTMGLLTSGPVGTWEALNTNPTWYLTDNLPGNSVSAPLTVEIRLATAPFTVLDTATITLNVYVF
jgi:hypothetical protein